MLILGIESTCDETGCAIVKNGKEVLSNIVASQVKLHEEFGGVVPELACRRHVDTIIPVIDQALKEANTKLDEIDLIAVAHGPGLIGAILLGLNAAKALSLATNKPLIGINHIEAHLYAAIMSHSEPIDFPCLGAVLSGGHTSLVLIKDIGHYELLSQTVDDAIGEAFDKVAKILDLPYPGGPQIEALAQEGDPKRYPFKAGHVKSRPLDFSFSGIKTGVLYAVKGQNGKEAPSHNKADIAASFQHVVFTDVLKKTLKQAEAHNCHTIIFGGGVTNNQKLRKMFATTPYTLLWPTAGLSLDNAAMIAGLAFHQYHNHGPDDLSLEPMRRIPF